MSPPYRNANEMSRRLAVMSLMWMVAGLTGCTILPRLFGNDHAAQRAQQLEELQAKVMRFADGYVGRMIAPVAAFQTVHSHETERLAGQAREGSPANPDPH